ncbi:MAG TPA: hypothetical protein VFJ28_15605, partial [Marmoricola sp.]|nr:hypothetical protein [Marmoricola sp.]
MTSTTAPAPTASTARPPAPALTAGLLTILLGVVGGYGAIYFTGLEGWDAFGATYVTTYEWITLTGLVAAIAFVRGNHL